MIQLIAEIVDTKGYENLKETLGDDLGGKLYSIVNKAKKADKELNILHEGLTRLYNIDVARDTIKNMLNDIEQIR